MADKIYGFNEEQYARLADMLRAYEGGSLWPPAQRGRKPDERQLAKIRFRNDNSGTVPAWGVMRVTGASITTGGSWYQTTNKPNTTFYHSYLVNAGHDVETGKYGWGTYLWHASYVLCDSTYTPTAGQEWGPTNNSWSLVRNRPGFLIDGGATGSGSTYRAVAKQRVVTTILGDLVSTLSQGSSSLVNIFFGNAATGTLEDSGLTITAYDWFLGSGESWDATTRVMADFYSGRWWITQAACSPDSGGGGGGGGGGASSQSPATIGAGSGADMSGQFFPGGTDYGSAFDLYNEPIEFDSLLGG